MARLVNAYSISPDDIKPGDIMLFTVKAVVMREADDGQLRYRVYRCAWNGESMDDVPQGSQVAGMGSVCQSLFPSLALVGKPE